MSGFLALLGSYLLGSVPTAYLVVRRLKQVEFFKHFGKRKGRK